MFRRFKTAIVSQSASLVRAVDVQMPLILMIWVGLVSFACGLRIADPVMAGSSAGSMLVLVLPYALVIGGPVTAMLFALRTFPAGILYAQPEIRLARYGRWAQLDCVKVRRMSQFGASGWMVALMFLTLLNVPIRTIEFLSAIPALENGGPEWLQLVFYAMTANLTLMASLYAVAFVMALRLVPWFPRFIVMVWGIDLILQLGVGRLIVSVPDLPPEAATTLHAMLAGNIVKAGLSIALWLPYLLMSDRVNLTYRSRVRI